METEVKPGEPIDIALKRFRRQCQKEGVLAELKKRAHYEKPSEKRKRKALRAQRRKR